MVGVKVCEYGSQCSGRASAAACSLLPGANVSRRYEASKDDLAVYSVLGKVPAEYVNVTRWSSHIQGLLGSRYGPRSHRIRCAGCVGKCRVAYRNLGPARRLLPLKVLVVAPLGASRLSVPLVAAVISCSSGDFRCVEAMPLQNR